jgi:hypothetical protein
MTQGRMGGGTVPVKVEVGCAVQLRWKGKRYAQATWPPKRSQEGRLTGSSQCVPAPGVGNANSGGLAIRPGSSVSGHSALATKSATVVCGDQRTHWSPRCRSKRAITSPTIRR